MRTIHLHLFSQAPLEANNEVVCLDSPPWRSKQSIAAETRERIMLHRKERWRKSLEEEFNETEPLLW
jgi:hypothetical protein